MNSPDVTMMILVHNAFRHDLAAMSELVTAEDPVALDTLRTRWHTFSTYLNIHHTAEDQTLWPLLEAKLGTRTTLLTDMTEEHARLDPLVEKIETALAQSFSTELPALLAQLSETLAAHLDHEESAALPLIEQALSAREWNSFAAAQRRQVGIAGAARVFPWLLDGASDTETRHALGLLPAPLRLVYRTVWQPRYRRGLHPATLSH
ncbi:hemerythrin domain-containing protein [Nocardia nepalensis]|uniref:hemerythrin domain-containing protein n=1 Tax=Nocardia nepalensis TaxID=3375448 RepID=UPI003B682819